MGCNNQPTTEGGSAKIARGMQVTAKRTRRSSSALCNNQPTTKQGTAKVARENQAVDRSKEEEQQRAMHQPTNNYSR